MYYKYFFKGFFTICYNYNTFSEKLHFFLSNFSCVLHSRQIALNDIYNTNKIVTLQAFLYKFTKRPLLFKEKKGDLYYPDRTINGFARGNVCAIDYVPSRKEVYLTKYHKVFLFPGFRAIFVIRLYGRN